MAERRDDPEDCDEVIARRLVDIGFRQDEHGHFTANDCSVWIYHRRGDWHIDLRVGGHYVGCGVVVGTVWSRKIE